LDLVIARSEGVVSIDNQPLAIDTTPVPSIVSIVAYDCSGGAGNIEYNDRLRLLEPFIDVTPYVSLVNAWLTAAELVAISLAQAKQVKIGLVDGIFNSKRQLPIMTQGNTWDATDQSLLGMQSSVMAWDVAGAVTVADAILSDNVNKVQYLGAMPVGVAASAAVATTGTVSYYDAGVDSGATSTFATGASGGGVTQQPVVVASKGGVDSAPLSQPTIDWPPLNSTVMVRMSMANMRALITSIQTRRTSLQNTQIAKKNAINALTTVAAVIAYDVTTGWPSS
jgi:hypothetical protein